MQSSFEKDISFSSEVSDTASSELKVPGESVTTEPMDETGILLLETRIAADGTKRTRTITRKGWPVKTLEECMQMDCPFPPEPD